MNAMEIKPDIFWVGAVDFNNRDFHGYSLSPSGSTYNAYLIKDEKTVLFDTVSKSFMGHMHCRISQVTPLEKIDYIVCNHMELDHAGALAETIARCKPEKIFCSPMAMKSMPGYFDCADWPVQVVKTGDEISIGKRSIKFFETRMIHWPDSMVSYIPQDKLLITNDAFGQNIATTERYGDQVDRTMLMNSIKEYYYNIVLPFSPLVLKAIESLSALDIDMIAPDHGVIHRGAEGVNFIINAYKTMAEQKMQEKALIIYDTMWKSTEKMAYSIASGLEEVGVPSRIMCLKNNHHSHVMTELANCGAVIVGSSTHNNGMLPAVAGMLTYMKGLKPQNRIGAAFGSYGWSGESIKHIQTWLTEMKIEMPLDELKCNWAPKHANLAESHEFGKKLGQALKERCKQ